MERRPNFLIIHSDQQRYDCVGHAGRRTGVYTPYIDSIGNQGAHFTACYANCPVCIPQRMTFLTGQTPAHHGLFHNFGVAYYPVETTLPAEMRRGGYQTALVGRTMHTYPFKYSYGFEYYLPGDPSNEDRSTDAFFRYVKANAPEGEGGYYGNGAQNNARAGVPFHLEDRFHQTKWAVNQALEFLETRDASRPYMLFVGFYAPHSPHNPPADYFNRFYSRTDLDQPYIADWDVPPATSGGIGASYINLKGEDLRAAYAGYYGNIAFLDAQIGRLLGAIDRNTYVIFTSDHGDLMGDHYMYQKSRPYEGSCHIPLEIMGPGIRFGQTLDQPVGWHDLMPTILDLAGLEVPESVDGRSMAPLLKEGKDDSWRSYMHGECVHFYHSTDERNTAPEGKHNYFFEKGSQYLTDGKMKYIWYVTSGKEQLFDLENDFKELHDLSELPEYQEELKMWRERLVKILDGREEGFVEDGHLVAGKTPQRGSLKAQKIAEQRTKEGFPLAYFGKKKDRYDDLDFEDHLMK